MKFFTIASISVIIFLSGCVQNTEDNENLQNQINNLNNQIESLQSTITEQNNTITKLNRSVYSCEDASDCILTVAGCNVCPSCNQYNLTDPEIIAVNKDLYFCPPEPSGLACIACVDSFNFNPQTNVDCVNNRCVKSNL